MTVYSYSDRENNQIDATFHKSTKQNKDNPLIIYIHGGGLIYGSKDDLPLVHIEKFTQVGFNILALDYPLIPESSLETLINSLLDGINWGISKFTTNDDFILFGRSAGAYLSLILSAKFLDIKPKAIISFYGYYSLMDKELKKPSDFYVQYPLLDDVMIAPLIQKQPLFNAPIEQRFPIYLSYRQRGIWVSKMLAHVSNIENYSLADDDIRTLPPLFIAVSKDDQDVPYTQSIYLHDLATKSDIYTLNGLPHDFDRLVDDVQTKKAYLQLMNWLICLQKRRL